MKRTQSSDREMPLWWEVTRWVLTALGLYTGAFWVLGWIYSGHPGWPGKHDKPNMYDLSRSSAAMAGILGGAAAIAVALRRQRSTEKSVRIAADAQQTSADAQQTAARAQEIAAAAQKVDADAYRLDLRRTENDRVTALRNRYTEAARQLGDPSAAVRLAGAYAMAALADDWITRNEEMEEGEGAAWIRDPDAQACIDVLCAYIRTPRRYPGDRTPTDPTDEGDATEYLADREVRQTIIRITRDHLRENAPRSWRGFDLDYTGAVFDGICDFSRAVFSGGVVTFDRVEFTSGRVSFARAQFEESTTSFENAVFSADAEVTFGGAEIVGGTVLFSETRFAGKADFHGMRFEDGVVAFTAATFATVDVSFDGAQFSGARVTFYGTTVASAKLSFFNANFSDGRVLFGTMKLVDGGELLFPAATFDGAKVSFDSIKLSGGQVSFASHPKTLHRPAMAPNGGFPLGPWPGRPPWPLGVPGETLPGDQWVWPLRWTDS